MKGYQAIYVCRLCGERYSTERPIESCLTAEGRTGLSCQGYNSADVPRLNAMHKCKDGSIGVGDFQGYQYQREGEE